jgi:glycosyltransferase involved in cell wall biosynthesis
VPEADPSRTGRTRPYALYVGRLDESKGTELLVACHREYRSAHPAGLDLVLVGTGPWRPPAEPWLIATGWVDEAAKRDLVAGAAAVVIPSPYESLSLSQLEAWAAGRPTLANAASPVLVGQSRRAGGGLWFRDAQEYAVMLDMIARNPALATAIGRQGRRYAEVTYSWEHVHAAWREVIADGAAAPGRRA